MIHKRSFDPGQGASVGDMGDILHVAEDPKMPGLVTVWYLALPYPGPYRHFVIVPTGGQCPETAWLYAGTAVMKSGLVWHLLEIVYDDQ